MKRANVSTALVLIAIGVWFLAIELIPGVKAFAYGSETWPIPIIGVGALLGLVGIVSWVPGMLIPASIVSGIGALLFWQNTTGNWESWAYAWALIPIFVGVGIMLAGLLSRQRRTMAGGLWVAVIGLVLLAVFGSFLGGWEVVGRYWPVVLILLGLLFLGRGLVRSRPRI
jgi:hypothetical protein